MNTLLYLSYGLGPFTDEVVFSILSAHHLAQDSRDFRILIYTDTPTLFEGIDAEVVALTPAQLVEWSGPSRFPWRRKIVALQHALARHSAPTVVLDGDTYFLRQPRQLFERLAPGQSIMHLEEGRIEDLIALGPLRTQLPMQRYTLADGSSYALADQPMWNAGVVGVDPADAAKIDEVLELTDTMQAQNPDRLSEQTAFSAVLNRRTSLQPCRDVVFHYHPAFIRTPFREQLAASLPHWGRLPLFQRAEVAYAHRPIPPLAKRAKAVLKRMLKPLSCFRYDLETSV